MSTLQMQQVVERVVAITGADQEVTYNQFRVWVRKGLIPAAETHGTGVGTRRRYDRSIVALAAIMVRLSQLGVAGRELYYKARLVTGWLQHIRFPSHQVAEAQIPPTYLVALAAGSHRGMVLSEFTDTPTAAMLEQVPGGAAFVVDVAGIARQVAAQA